MSNTSTVRAGGSANSRRRFTVVDVIPLEIFSPAIARFAGYHVHPRWTRADVRLAAHMPKEIASEVIFILRKDRSR